MLYKALFALLFVLYVCGGQDTADDQVDTVDTNDNNDVDNTDDTAFDTDNNDDNGDTEIDTETNDDNDTDLDTENDDTEDTETDDIDDTDNDDTDDTDNDDDDDTEDTEDDGEVSADTETDDNDDDDDDDDDTSLDTEDDAESVDAETESNDDDDDCLGLAASACVEERNLDGDNECGYNAQTNECYSVVRRAGLNGVGTFDDGFVAARKLADAENSNLETVVAVLGGVIATLFLVIVGGAYCWHKSSRAEFKHNMQMFDLEELEQEAAMPETNGTTAGNQRV